MAKVPFLGISEDVYDELERLKAENAKLKEALLEIQDYAISPWIVKDRCEQALKGESDGK